MNKQLSFQKLLAKLRAGQRVAIEPCGEHAQRLRREWAGRTPLVIDLAAGTVEPGWLTLGGEIRLDA